MPAIFAHKLLATEVITKVNKDIQKVINSNFKSYLAGTLGPDPFYFYGFYKGLPLTNKADLIHRIPATLFFDVKIKNDKELAFILGLITHYTLDKNVHNHIHKIENEYSHVRLERELEYLLLKKNNIEPNNYNFYEHINIDTDLLAFLSELFKIPIKKVKKAYKDTKIIIKYAYSQNKFIKALVKIIMKISFTYKNNKDMLLSTDILKEDKKQLEIILKLWEESKEEVIININNYYAYLKEKEQLSENFYYNFEGEEDD